ncbi:hypothetical protein ACA910_001057 [Epithemia clementina (nom. ined.)]
MLLIEGLSKFTRRSPLGEKAAAEYFLRRLEDIVNCQILGDEAHEAQWKCPVSDDKREIVVGRNEDSASVKITMPY